MSQMIERVAKALCDDEGISLDEGDTYWRGLARTAIEAMRPDEDFVWDAAYKIEPMLRCIGNHDLGSDEALKIFNAVIDAALAEGKLK